jgi:hypothetical protein
MQADIGLLVGYVLRCHRATKDLYMGRGPSSFGISASAAAACSVRLQ